MKAPFLSFSIFFLLISSLLVSVTVSAKSIEKPKTISSFDYADPTSPFELPRFQEWASRQTAGEILQYINDENYRELVNNWNAINNPFWADAITALCPWGTFDFTAGLSKTNEVVDYGNLKEHQRYDYNLNPIQQTNILGQPYFYSRTIQDAAGNTVGPKKLPVKNPKTTTVYQQVTEQLDFTKHVTTVYTSWSQNKGFNKRDRAITSGIQTYINTNQSYYEQGIGTSTNISNSQSPTGTRYMNYSNSKGSSAAPVSSTSSSSKTVSTGRSSATTTSSN